MPSGAFHRDLEPPPLQLRFSTYEQLDIIYILHVHVAYKTREECLPLLVVKGTGTSLLGRDWLSALAIGLIGVNQVLEG